MGIVPSKDENDQERDDHHQDYLQENQPEPGEVEISQGETGPTSEEEVREKQFLHQKTMNFIEVTTAVQKVEKEIARVEDGKEKNFADAVNNTRSGMTNLSNSISSMGEYANSLEDGEAIPNKTKNSLKKCCSDASTKLRLFIDSASQIQRFNTKDSDGNVAECHRIALGIDEACITLSESLGEFKGSLETNKDCRKLHNKMLEHVRNLSKVVSSFPVLSQSDYTINTISRHVEVLAVSGNGVLRMEAATTSRTLITIAANNELVVSPDEEVPILATEPGTGVLLNDNN